VQACPFPRWHPLGCHAVPIRLLSSLDAVTSGALRRLPDQARTQPNHGGAAGGRLTRRWWHSAGLGVVLSLLGTAHADIYVITHPGDPVKTLTRQQVLDVYFSPPTMVLDLPRGDARREQFFQSLATISSTRVDDYWIRLAYAGAVTPLKTAPNDQAILAIVRRTPGAIGYVQSVPQDGSVQTVLHLPH
jgi:hypothetical protein